MKRKTVISIVLIIVIFLTLGYKYWQKPIDISYSAIRFVIGEEDFKEVKVSIKGVWYSSFFRDDRLMYEIFIDGNRIPFNKEGKYVVPGQFRERPFTFYDVVSHNNPMMDEQISEKNHSGAEYLTTEIEYNYMNKKGNLEFFAFGKLCFPKKMEDLIIMLYRVNGSNGSWRSTEGYEIIVTKSNIEEAERFALELMNMNISTD